MSAEQCGVEKWSETAASYNFIVFVCDEPKEGRECASSHMKGKNSDREKTSQNSFLAIAFFINKY